MENKHKLLIVDNEKAILDSFKMLFEKYFMIEISETIQDAIKKLKNDNFKIAIIDMAFPNDNEGGLKIIKFINENKINTKAIVLTAFGSESNFKKSHNEGIFDYVEKGSTGANEILLHSALYAASLPPEIRIFLTEDILQFFNILEADIKLSKIEIISEGLRLLKWAIDEWKNESNIASIKNDKIKVIENLYSRFKN